MRTIVDIPQEDIDRLDRLRERENASRAELVRRAVSVFLEEQDTALATEAFGIWRTKPVDALALEASLRDEWGR